MELAERLDLATHPTTFHRCQSRNRPGRGRSKESKGLAQAHADTLCACRLRRTPFAGFLDSEFPGLTLDAVTARPAQWPALRLELAPGIPDGNFLGRIEEATKTAVMIFERVFSPEDEGFLSVVRWKDNDDTLFLRLLPPGCHPARSEGRDFYGEGEEDEWEEDRYVTYSATLRPRSVDYRSMFRLIAGSDFAQPRSLDGYAYFAKTSPPMIFHMYDDRGAMLLATKPEHIADLRAQFEDWIIP